MMMTPTSIHSVINLSGKAGEKATKILNTYDLVAMRPDPKQNKQETIYEQVFTKGDGDIISLELSQRLDFYFQKTWVKFAITKCIAIELVYGPGCFEPKPGKENSSKQRKQFLMNAM